MGVVGRAGRTALAIGGSFVVVDVWYVALSSPGALSPSTLGWLIGLYLVTAMVAAVLAHGTLHRWWDPEAEQAQAFLAGCGAFLVAQEVGLRSLQPLSAWRPLAVAVALAVGVAVGWGVWSARRWRLRWAWPVGALLLALGMIGAVRGFDMDLGGGGPLRRPAAEAPNVMVVLIDTLRADHLGCYGYERPTSPHIDALAEESTTFTRAFSQSTWTKPATASLFTGRFPSQHQAYLEQSRLPESEVLLPEALRALGYRTAVFSGNPWVTPDYGFGQGVDDFHSMYDERFARATLYMMTLKRLSKLIDRKRRVYNRVKRLIQGDLSTTERDVHLTGQVLRWLDRHGAAPFFLHVHYMSPHHPYDPPPPYDRFVPDRSREPVTVYPRKSYFFFDEGDPLPPADLADLIARYDGDVRFVDDVVGRLLEGLAARGLDDRTLLVLTSDHGEEFYEHRNWGHGQSVYNELMHVPLIVRYPRHFPPGRRVEASVMTADIMPTVLDLVGASERPTMAGTSLLRVLAGEAPSRSIYGELIYRYGRATALVQDGHKVIRMSREDETRTALYDLGRDFGERHAVIDGAEHDDFVERLAGVEATAGKDQSAPAEEVEIDAEMARRLKALGYLD